MGTERGGLLEERGSLFERRTELAAIEDALERAVHGIGSALLFEGPAGIGKSRLLGVASSLALEREMVVLRARGGELEREMPFGIARQWFEPLLARAHEHERREWLSGGAQPALSALERIGATAGLEVDRFAVMNGFYWLAANVAGTRPVVMIFDDAQWSDNASLQFAAFLVRRLIDHPLLLVSGIRTGEPDEPAELVALRAESLVLSLSALTGGSVRDLIKERSGSEPAERFAEACARATAGNPFLILEILRELSADGTPLDARAAEMIEDLAPESVARTVLFRLARFGRQAIDVARAISVLGHAPQMRHVTALAETDEASTRAICDRLRVAEILTLSTSVEFVHPLVRQAIYKEQPPGARSDLHRRAAEILSETGMPVQESAAHLMACDPNGDPWVVEELLRAAENAIAEGAFEAAVAYLDRALAEPPTDDIPVLKLLGRACQENDVFRARRIYGELAQRVVEPRDKVDALRREMVNLISVGDLVGGAATCDEALSVLGDADREIMLDLEAQRCFLRFSSVGIDPETSRRIEKVAGGLTGATSGERIARQGLSLQGFMTCEPLGSVLDLVLPSPELPWQIDGIESPVTIAVQKMLAWCGRFDDARRELTGWIEPAHQTGRLLVISIGNSFLSEVDRLNGNLLDAEARARTAWEIAQLPGGMSPFLWSALMNLAQAFLARGDTESFIDLTQGMDLSAGPTEIPLNPWPLEARAYFKKLTGDIEGAVDDFLSVGDALERIGWLNPALPPHWRQEATEGLAALGREKEAHELIEVALERAESFGAPHTIASVMRAQAMVQARRRAIEMLRGSAEIFERCGLPHELSRSLIALGGTLRRDGQKADAKEVLMRALELSHRCGAGALEVQAREELTILGVRPRGTVRAGIGTLTASEMRAAKLAAQGLTNKEIAERLFVTLRTVETHLTHVYEKLAIGGRPQLATALEQGST